MEVIDLGWGKTPSSLLLNSGTTKEGTNEISELFGKKGIFDYPKPTKLIETLLSFGSSSNCIVLLPKKVPQVGQVTYKIIIYYI